jgi:hypothetical protein
MTHISYDRVLSAALGKLPVSPWATITHVSVRAVRELPLLDDSRIPRQYGIQFCEGL